MEKKFVLPKGATPEEADWEAVVTSRIKRSQEGSNPREERSCAERLLQSMGTGLHKLCSIDNADTDTQAAIWADFRSKQLVLSFRGTEQIKVKDVLTDINLVQTKFFPEKVVATSQNDSENELCEQLAEVLCHKGFLSAFRSIEPALLQLLEMVITSDGGNDNTEKCACDSESWDVYITGHSLGGALASLAAFDLARIGQGCYGAGPSFERTREEGDKTLYHKLFGEKWSDPALGLLSKAGARKKLFVSALQEANLVVYTYGAPRVGNMRFSQLSDRLAPHSFRIINQNDVVPRVPRSSASNRVLEYSHAGRTVAILSRSSSLNAGTHDPDCDPDPYSCSELTVWVEGEDSGMSPTQELSPFEFDSAVSGLPSNLFKFGIEGEAGEASIGQEVGLKEMGPTFDAEEKVASLLVLHPTVPTEVHAPLVEKTLQRGQGLLLSQLPTILEAVGIGHEEIEKIDGLYKIAASISGGVQPKFVEGELALLASILDQRAIEHHLEPSYFRSLSAIVDTKRTGSAIE